MNSKISRRDFLVKGGAGTAGLFIAGLAAPAQASGSAPPETTWGVLIDLTRCSGCNACALACQATNQRPADDHPPGGLSSRAYTFVEQRQVDDQAGPQYIKRQCMHCRQPACVSACTVGALQKTADGPVIYEADRCIGCRYCQYACPFGVPAYEWDNVLGLIHKCQMCATRLAEGQPPACVAACPTGALRLGYRQNLLAQAHAQIESNPDRYVDHIYGEFEAGGTAMLYLAAVPFAQLGFPDLGPDPIPHQAETVMEMTPWVAATVAGLATLLHFLNRPLIPEADS